MMRHLCLLLLILPLFILAGCPGDDKKGSNVDPVTQEMGNGESFDFGIAEVTVPDDTMRDNTEITVDDAEAPEEVPTGFTQVGHAFEIEVADPDLLNAPVIVTLDYDDADVTDEDNMLVLHYDEDTGWEPATVMSQDPDANTITMESRAFSTFSIVEFANALLPSGHMVTGFQPNPNGWEIVNTGSYFSPGGDCLGMSGMCTWFFKHRSGENLWGKFPATPVPSISHLVAGRAMLAQSQYWALKQHNYQQTLAETTVVTMLKAMLTVFNQPIILTMTSNNAGHACVVYGFDDDEFFFYDVNVPGAQQSLPYNGAGFGNYGTYTNFGFVGLPSLGRTEDFNALVTQAEGGFANSQYITVNNPLNDEVITERHTDVDGMISGVGTQDWQLAVYVNGVLQPVGLSSGSFNFNIPVASGDNTLVFVAGHNLSQQSNWYRNSATLIRYFEGDFPLANLLVTMVWGQNDTDVDLYVTEPSGGTSWYGSHTTGNGMYLDFDNTSGYGPEHVILSAQDGHTVESGVYTVRVHYYSDHDTGQGASGTVTILLNEGTENVVWMSFPYSIGPSNPSNQQPGSSGADWVDIAEVDVVNGTITALP